MDDTLQRLGDDQQLFYQVLRWFAADLPNTLAGIETCLVSGDAQKTREAVHKLKGSAANAGAIGLHAMVVEAEQLCKANELAKVKTRMVSVRQEINQIITLIEQLDD